MKIVVMTEYTGVNQKFVDLYLKRLEKSEQPALVRAAKDIREKGEFGFEDPLPEGGKAITVYILRKDDEGPSLDSLEKKGAFE